MSGLNTLDKFTIAQRFDFTCCYCGGRPGNDSLNIDHLIPWSKGGSDDDLNLCVACSKCNRGKLDRFYLPSSMSIGKDSDGFSIYRQWGIWSIKFGNEVSDMAVVSGQISANYDYWFDHTRFWESDWERHISEKTWPHPHNYFDFDMAISVARRMVRR